MRKAPDVELGERGGRTPTQRGVGWLRVPKGERRVPRNRNPERRPWGPGQRGRQRVEERPVGGKRTVESGGRPLGRLSVPHRKGGDEEGWRTEGVAGSVSASSDTGESYC